MSLKPILKAYTNLPSDAVQSSTNTPVFPFAACKKARLYSPRVHFPPTPCIVASFHVAYSPTAYDRAPIVVSPNHCALPERGGRSLDSYFHPRAFEASQVQEGDGPSPAMQSPSTTIHEVPSESDDSDGYGSPAQISSPRGLAAQSQPNYPIPNFERALSFLPHPHTPKITSRKRRKISRSAQDVSFHEPSLDGCLGGF